MSDGEITTEALAFQELGARIASVEVDRSIWKARALKAERLLADLKESADEDAEEADDGKES